MENKEAVKKIISFLLVGVLFICCVSALAPILNASSNLTTIELTGEDLYALLQSGTWETIFTAMGTDYQNSTFQIYNLNTASVPCVGIITPLNLDTPYLDTVEYSISFELGFDYSEVTNFNILVGSTLQYIESPTNLNKLLYPSTVQGIFYGSYTSTFNGVSTGRSNNALYYGIPIWELNLDMNNETISNFMCISRGSYTPSSYGVKASAGLTLVESISITYKGPETGELILGQLEEANRIMSEQLQEDKDYHDKVTTLTPDDENKLNEQQEAFDKVQQEADEYNNAMDSVEKPAVDDVLPDESLDTIFDDPNIVTGQPYFFSILESLQGISWLLTMILISVSIGVIKYVIYGRG